MASFFIPSLLSLDLPSVDGSVFDVLCDSAALIDEAEADAVDAALAAPMSVSTPVSSTSMPSPPPLQSDCFERWVGV